MNQVIQKQLSQALQSLVDTCGKRAVKNALDVIVSIRCPSLSELDTYICETFGCHPNKLTRVKACWHITGWSLAKSIRYVKELKKL